jgi:hypothetical protein
MAYGVLAVQIYTERLDFQVNAQNKKIDIEEIAKDMN